MKIDLHKLLTIFGRGKLEGKRRRTQSTTYIQWISTDPLPKCNGPVCSAKKLETFLIFCNAGVIANSSVGYLNEPYQFDLPKSVHLFVYHILLSCVLPGPISQTCPVISDVRNSDDSDPLAPYATSQLILTHQHLLDPMNQQVM